MQLAEKTHYRKGLALGLTMAEIFSIIVFMLLYRELQDSLDKTQKRIQSLQSENGRIEAENESLRSSLQSAEFRSRLPEKVASYKGKLNVLTDSLGQAMEDLRRIRQRNNELDNQLRDSQNRYMTAISELERMSHLDSIQIGEQLQRTVRFDSLEEALNQTRGIITRFYNLQIFGDSLENISTEDSLRTISVKERERSQAYIGQVTRATREREEAVNRAKLREEQLEQLMGGRGIDPPPCWLSKEKRPEYILRIELTNNGFQTFNIAPSHHIDDPVMVYLAAIQDGYEYTPSQFLDKTRPIYDEGRGRTDSYGPSGCRFWIRPVDKTGSSKEVFRVEMPTLADISGIAGNFDPAPHLLHQDSDLILTPENP